MTNLLTYILVLLFSFTSIEIVKTNLKIYDTMDVGGGLENVMNNINKFNDLSLEDFVGLLVKEFDEDIIGLWQIIEISQHYDLKKVCRLFIKKAMEEYKTVPVIGMVKGINYKKPLQLFSSFGYNIIDISNNIENLIIRRKLDSLDLINVYPSIFGIEGIYFSNNYKKIYFDINEIPVDSDIYNILNLNKKKYFINCSI